MAKQTWLVDLEEFVWVFGSDLFRFEELQAVAAEEDVAKAIHLSSEKNRPLAICFFNQAHLQHVAMEAVPPYSTDLNIASGSC